MTLVGHRFQDPPARRRRTHAAVQPTLIGEHRDIGAASPPSAIITARSASTTRPMPAAALRTPPRTATSSSSHTVSQSVPRAHPTTRCRAIPSHVAVVGSVGVVYCFINGEYSDGHYGGGTGGVGLGVSVGVGYEPGPRSPDSVNQCAGAGYEFYVSGCRDASTHGFSGAYVGYGIGVGGGQSETQYDDASH